MSECLARRPTITLSASSCFWFPPQLCWLSYYWANWPSVREKLLSYINAPHQYSWWKQLEVHLILFPSSLKTQSSNCPISQGLQPVHPGAPLAPIHLRYGTERPSNQPALVLICLHWNCCRDPQQRFQPFIVISQGRWLWVSCFNSW